MADHNITPVLVVLEINQLERCFREAQLKDTLTDQGTIARYKLPIGGEDEDERGCLLEVGHAECCSIY